MYTFKITDKVCYKAPVPGAKEIAIEGEDIFAYQYKTCYDLHLYAEKEAFTVSTKNYQLLI